MPRPGLERLADVCSQSRLNIPDMPMGGFATGPAVAAPATQEEEEAAPPVQEKTLFTLTLKSFDTAAKPKNHQRDQEHAGIESGRQQEVCGKCTKDDEGICSKRRV